MTRWLREPVVHFVVLGAAVFAVYATVQPQPTHSLTADDAPIEQLRNDWETRMGTSPSAAEEQRLRKEWLEEEVLYRRARELGLDQNDTVVRRRLVQRMRFLIKDTTPVPEPNDLQLRAWIDTHPEKYSEASRVSLDHLFFSRAKRGIEMRADAYRAAEALKATPDASVAGDPFPRGNHLDDYTKSALAQAFGVAFADSVTQLPVGSWHGPLNSSYGVHVVRVTARTAQGAPSFEGVRDRARGDWMYEERQRLNRQAIEAMVERQLDSEGARP